MKPFSKQYDIIFPAVIASVDWKHSGHANACNPYAGFEMLREGAEHLEVNQIWLFTAKVKIHFVHKNSTLEDPQAEYQKIFKPDMYKNCHLSEEQTEKVRHFWFFEDVDFQRRDKLTLVEYRALLSLIGRHDPRLRVEDFFKLSLGALWFQPSLGTGYTVMERLRQEDYELFCFITKLIV